MKAFLLLTLAFVCFVGVAGDPGCDTTATYCANPIAGNAELDPRGQDGNCCPSGTSCCQANPLTVDGTWICCSGGEQCVEGILGTRKCQAPVPPAVRPVPMHTVSSAHVAFVKGELTVSDVLLVTFQCADITANILKIDAKDAKCDITPEDGHYDIVSKVKDTTNAYGGQALTRDLFKRLNASLAFAPPVGQLAFKSAIKPAVGDYMCGKHDTLMGSPNVQECYTGYSGVCGNGNYCKKLASNTTIAWPYADGVCCKVNKVPCTARTSCGECTKPDKLGHTCSWVESLKGKGDTEQCTMGCQDTCKSDLNMPICYNSTKQYKCAAEYVTDISNRIVSRGTCYGRCLAPPSAHKIGINIYSNLTEAQRTQHFPGVSFTNYAKTPFWNALSMPITSAYCSCDDACHTRVWPDGTNDCCMDKSLYCSATGIMA